VGKYSEVYSKPIAMNMIEEDGKIWMTLLNRNGICVVEETTRCARICKIFEDEPVIKEFLYCNVEKIGNNLVFSPWEAENIAIYNLKTDSITYIPINTRDEKRKENSDATKFWNMIRYQSAIYLLGYSYPAIIKIDMESLSVEYITDWVEEVEKNIDIGDSNGYFGDGYVIAGDVVLLPIGCMSAILELNVKTSKTRLRKLNTSMKGIGGIASKDCENIWLVGRGNATNKVCCWNIWTDNIKEIPLNEDCNINHPFYSPICMGSRVFLMPISASCIYELNIDKGEPIKHNTLEVQTKKQSVSLWPYWKTMAPRLQNGKLVYITCDDLRWHEYNFETGELQSYNVSIKEEPDELERYFKAVYEKQKEKAYIFFEAKIPLEFFVKEEKRVTEQYLCEENRTRFNGSEIYDRMCRNM